MRRPTLDDLMEPNNLRLIFAAQGWIGDLVRGVKGDATLLAHFARAITSLDAGGPLPESDPVFPAFRPLSVPALDGKRVAVAASGGSGATASMLGVQRAFEEAEIRPVLISACSGSVLFAALWAAGIDAERAARFWFGLKQGDYLDPDWPALRRAARRGFRGFGGLVRGEAIERTFENLLGKMTLGQARIPLSLVVWNVDHNTVEHFGTHTTPDLTIARAVRVAISIPVFVEPVEIGGHLYGDGGVVDVFPTAALATAEPLDRVFGINNYLPPDFRGNDVSGWRDRTWSILHASGQLRFSGLYELAREHAAALGERLVMVTPTDYREVRGSGFYDVFVDRRNWPRFVRQGYDATRTALERFG
jgi:NTE family protein